VDYGVKGIVLAGEEVKVNFWDLAGSKEYLEVRNEFYKDSQGCLLVRNCNLLLELPAALSLSLSPHHFQGV
jgi:GTPase SAR1 family protein